MFSGMVVSPRVPRFTSTPLSFFIHLLFLVKTLTKALSNLAPPSRPCTSLTLRVFLNAFSSSSSSTFFPFLTLAPFYFMASSLKGFWTLSVVVSFKGSLVLTLAVFLAPWLFSSKVRRSLPWLFLFSFSLLRTTLSSHLHSQVLRECILFHRKSTWRV